MNISLNWRLRVGVCAFGLALAGLAGAQTTVYMQNGWPSMPGIQNFDNGAAGGGFNGYQDYAGVLNWQTGSSQSSVQISGGSPLDTLCCSVNQDFGEGGGFYATQYSLTGATPDSDQVGLDGLGSGEVLLPTADTDGGILSALGGSGYSSMNFLHAAELFGGLYQSIDSNESAAALQIAVWETLYPNYSASLPTALATDVATDLRTDVDSSELANVEWYEFTTGNVGSGGQSQFSYVDGGGPSTNLTPGSTPGPVAVLPFALGLLRRRRAKKTTA